MRKGVAASVKDLHKATADSHKYVSDGVQQSFVGECDSCQIYFKQKLDGLPYNVENAASTAVSIVKSCFDIACKTIIETLHHIASARSAT